MFKEKHGYRLRVWQFSWRYLRALFFFPSTHRHSPVAKCFKNMSRLLDSQKEICNNFYDIEERGKKKERRRSKKTTQEGDATISRTNWSSISLMHYRINGSKIVLKTMSKRDIWLLKRRLICRGFAVSSRWQNTCWDESNVQVWSTFCVLR